MSNIKVFDGTSDIMDWDYQIRTKLTAKGLRSQLDNANRLADGAPAQAEWLRQADKALGTIGAYLHKDVA